MESIDFIIMIIFTAIVIGSLYYLKIKKNESSTPTTSTPKPTTKASSNNNNYNNETTITQKQAYKYYKFRVITVRKERNCYNDNSLTCTQITEFLFYDGLTKLIPNVIRPSPNENYVTNQQYYSGGGVDQRSINVFDNNLNTKWLDFSVPTEFVFEFNNPVNATRYSWVTADDVPDRDPISWSVSGSNDNVNWTVLSIVTGYNPTTTRNKQIDNTFDLFT